MNSLSLQVAGILTVILATSMSPALGQTKIAVLRIGFTVTMTGVADSAKEKAGAETLRRFIKEETGLNNEVLGQEKWQDLAAKMVKGQYELGVFQGYEFAWAKERSSNLKPLALGVNVTTYPVACIVVKRDNPAKNFAELKKKALVIPIASQGFVRLFVDRQCAANELQQKSFFSGISSSEQVEDTLDDIVDGKVQAAAIDQTTLDAYKQQKPGRFKQLREVARSQKFPPIVVAYWGSTLDEATLRRFKSGLLGASKKEKGELLLMQSRLTTFEEVPAGFDEVLVETLKNYPSP